MLEEVNDWRNRPLEKLYPIVFIDGFLAWLQILTELKKSGVRKYFYFMCRWIKGFARISCCYSRVCHLFQKSLINPSFVITF